jgi:hypothetical protein
MFGSKTSASLLAFLAGRLRGYLPIFSRILLEKVGGTYLSENSREPLRNRNRLGISKNLTLDLESNFEKLRKTRILGFFSILQFLVSEAAP